MDIKKLKKIYPKLLEYMEANGFGRVAIDSVNIRLRLLFEHEGEYESYADFYSKFISKEGLNGNNRRLRYYRTAVRTIQGYDEFGHYPNRLKFAPVQYRECSYKHLNPIFKGIVDHYRQVALKEYKSAKSISVESNAASAFFYHMQRNGAKGLNGITGSMILSFFGDGSKQLRGYAYQIKIRAVLKAQRDRDCHAECLRIMADLPPLKKGRKNFSILKDKEVRTIKERLKDHEGTKLSLRDRAVVAVALYTGMRGCDIANMCIENIDWGRDLITLVQSKTKQPLVLPLRAVVGNPMVDYLKKERPGGLDIKNVFINEHCQEKPIDGNTIGGIARRFFEKLGIRCGESENGIRLFRRYLATRLLQKGVTPRYISEIMGHLSPESLHPYIDADITHLRECGLDISKYPIGKEVFDI